MDFCFWGFMKEKVYAVPLEDEQQLRVRIIEAENQFRQKDMIFQRIRLSLLKRYRMCIEENGGHFEHLL